jgi:hypothetical protein
MALEDFLKQTEANSLVFSRRICIKEYLDVTLNFFISIVCNRSSTVIDQRKVDTKMDSPLCFISIIRIIVDYKVLEIII